jgi:hypothetical protein
MNGVKRGTSNLSQSLKMTLFWDIASCGIVEVDWEVVCILPLSTWWRISTVWKINWKCRSWLYQVKSWVEQWGRGPMVEEVGYSGLLVALKRSSFFLSVHVCDAWPACPLQLLAHFLTLFPHLIITPFSHWSHQDSTWSNQFQNFQLIFACCLFVVLMMKAVCPSETSIYFSEITLHYIPEICHLQTCYHENLRSHISESVFPVL